MPLNHRLLIGSYGSNYGEMQKEVAQEIREARVYLGMLSQARRVNHSGARVPGIVFHLGGSTEAAT